MTDIKTAKKLMGNALFTFILAFIVGAMYYMMLIQLLLYAAFDREMPSKRFILTFILTYILLQLAVYVTKRMFKEVKENPDLLPPKR